MENNRCVISYFPVSIILTSLSLQRGSAARALQRYSDSCCITDFQKAGQAGSFFIRTACDGAIKRKRHLQPLTTALRHHSISPKLIRGSLQNSLHWIQIDHAGCGARPDASSPVCFAFPGCKPWAVDFLTNAVCSNMEFLEEVTENRHSADGIQNIQHLN